MSTSEESGPQKQSLKDLIPKEFYTAGTQPVVRTVGQLIEQLQKLPSWLPLGPYDEYAFGVCVYNIARHNPHVVLEEHEDEDDDDFWDDDDDDEFDDEDDDDIGDDDE